MVYVDEAQYHYDSMIMCHMIADTPEELLAMVDVIGVQRKWIQGQGTYREHFDISKSKRAAAIKRGAVPITGRQLAKKLRARRIRMLWMNEECE